MTIIRDHLRQVDDATLARLWGEHEIAEQTGSFPADSELRALARSLFPDGGGAPAVFMEMVAHEVWRETARRALAEVEVLLDQRCGTEEAW